MLGRGLINEDVLAHLRKESKERRKRWGGERGGRKGEGEREEKEGTWEQKGSWRGEKVVKAKIY